MKWYEGISKYFGIVMIAALALGFGLPSVFSPISKAVFYLLGIIIGISFLTLDFREFAGTIKQFHLPLGVFLFYKIALPTGLYLILSRWDRSVALAVLLLAATPVGIITPALAGLVGGDRAFVLALVIITAFAAPFYFPFLIKIIVGTRIEIDAVGMMFTLAKLVFIPFAASLVLRKWGKKLIDRTRHLHGAVSIFLLFFVILGVCARGAPVLRSSWTAALQYFGLSIPFCILLAGLGFFLFWFLRRDRRIGLAVAIPYMNMAMTIVIASEFFTPQVVLFCVVYEIPVNILPVILRSLVNRNNKSQGP